MTEKMDRVLLLNDQDGRVSYVRERGDGLEVGAACIMTEGQPLQPSEELVSLTSQEGSPWMSVNDSYKMETGSAERSGPAQVATAQYRDGWDVLWGQKKKEPISN